MALIIAGKTKCVICGKVLDPSDEVIGFPAFIPPGHEFSGYSDSAFHPTCFQLWSDHDRFQQLYDNYRKVWDSRPSDLSFAEAEEWGKHAFDDVRRV